jgi:hypothetical protein
MTRTELILAVLGGLVLAGLPLLHFGGGHAHAPHQNGGTHHASHTH